MVINDTTALAELFISPLKRAGYSKHWAQVQDRPRYKRAAVDKRRKRNRIARASRKSGH